MKKLMLLCMMMLLLVGCSSQANETTFMITRDNESFALYDKDGEQLTEYKYKAYEEVEKNGYIVTNDKDQKGYISYFGEEIIPFGEYETLEAVDQMLYATKKVDKTKNEKKEEKKDEQISGVHENLFVLDGKGEVLYTASKDVGIIKSGLPIIVKENEYIVLYNDGEEFQKSKEPITYIDQYKNSQYIVVGKEKESIFYDCSKEEAEEINIKHLGKYKIMCVDEILNHSAILYDKELKNMIYIDREEKKVSNLNMDITEAYYDFSNNIMLKNNKKTYLYQSGNKAIEMNSYYVSGSTYLVRSNVVYGPHTIYKNGKKIGELENCQLYPAGYLMTSEIFPVYVKGEGFKYYNFDNKQVIATVYLEAEPFDSSARAVVKASDKGYSLIDEGGVVLTKKTYSQIQSIGSIYYAIYNKDGKFGIIDKDGNEVLPIEYTDLPDTSIFTHNDNEYMLLSKNGRSYLYDVKDEMKEVFSIEGQLIFDERGYFVDGFKYYTFDGEVIE